MKTYSCPYITENICSPSDIIALSIKDDQANQDITVQVKEQTDFFYDWCDIFVDKQSD